MENNVRFQVKQELLDHNFARVNKPNPNSAQPPSVIELSSSDSDSSSEDGGEVRDSVKRSRDLSADVSNGKSKKKKVAGDLPVGFLDLLPSRRPPVGVSSTSMANVGSVVMAPVEGSVKQFWKAGDYEATPAVGFRNTYNGSMDHVRIHPKFLHSNATSHKWVLGAFAELLDNSLDEVCSGATHVNLDMVKSKKDGTKMLLVEDNGGGMDPDKIRQCMSLGYSSKSKMVDTIGQYGNGFKTSTMRLGADVIVFSRSRGKDGSRPTQSIGLLSYTFLRSTGKEDTVVPILDYERSGNDWKKIVRSSADDWKRNVETIVQWSPFSSEEDLLRQFYQMKEQGTRIFIYNLWEDDEGLLELDFDTDLHDIQIRGVNRDEKSIEMGKKYPNSRHFLTYRHSLRSYVAILYLRIPPGFRIILRGKDVEHHNIVNDMMMSQEITYRPQPGTDGVSNNSNMVAVVTVGFVKDAKYHIDVQGFNVYHKNRLIKPFWRVWHPPGSDGRGVIGVLEANFVEPAHDKQGFERTTVLARLEARLVQMQKTYWTTHCHKIGYAPRRNKKYHDRDASPDSFSPTQTKGITPGEKTWTNGHSSGKRVTKTRTPGKQPGFTEISSSSTEDVGDNDMQNHTCRNRANGSVSGELFDKNRSQRFPRLHQETEQNNSPAGRLSQSSARNTNSQANDNESALVLLEEENRQLKERLKRKEEEVLGDLLNDLQKEKERCKYLEIQVQESNRKYVELSKEQESIIDIFQEERQRRDIEEENLRKKLKEASNAIQESSNTIQELMGQIRLLEKKFSTEVVHGRIRD
ncbi:protein MICRORCHIDIA 7-like [Primulina huaijiensis]|uniref:protein MICRORCHIDIA 7-like n=1 Tax=Primulina huaijiensis TaxID=1492673 RepID=UPI003CC7098B